MSEWTTSPELTGYKTKVVRSGPCTIIINRPENVTDQQLQQTKTALESVLRDYYKRRTKQ